MARPTGSKNQKTGKTYFFDLPSDQVSQAQDQAQLAREEYKAQVLGVPVEAIHHHNRLIRRQMMLHRDTSGHWSYKLFVCGLSEFDMQRITLNEASEMTGVSVDDIKEIFGVHVKDDTSLLLRGTRKPRT